MHFSCGMNFLKPFKGAAHLTMNFQLFSFSHYCW